MNFGAAGALDDAQDQEGYVNINQMASMISNCIKTKLNVADDDTVNVADIGPLVNLPADALKDYTESTGRISINGIVNCAVSQLAQNSVRSIRAETQDVQTRHQGSALRRLTGELKAITRRQSELLGTQTGNSFDPAPSVTSLLGSNTQVLGSVTGSTYPHGFNIATFNELKTKNSDLSTQLSKADNKIGELKRLVLDKDYEIAQLNERIKGLMTDAANVPTMPQRAPTISPAELQSLQASFHEPLITLRGMLQDLHTAIIPASSSRPADYPISDETGLVDLEVKTGHQRLMLKEQVTKILTSIETILERQRATFKQLEEIDAHVLKALATSSESMQARLSSVQDTVINILEKRIGSTNNELVHTIKDYLDHLLASTSTTNQYTAVSITPEEQAIATIPLESRILSRMDIKDAVKDVLDVSYETLLVKLDELKESLMKGDNLKLSNIEHGSITSADLTAILATQTSELTILLSDMQKKVAEEVSACIEQRLSQIQTELVSGVHSLKGFLTKGSETLVNLTELSGRSPDAQSLADSTTQHWDANLVEGIAQDVVLKIQTKLDQYCTAAFPQTLIGQGSPYNQQSASVSGLLQAFVDSVFPDLKEGLQEIITKQFTIHMETFAEEQLRFAEALCRDFKSIFPEEIRENRSNQILVSEALRLENTLPTHTSQSTMLMEDGDPNCSPQDIVQGVSKLLEKKAPVISGIITKASKRALATASRRDSRRLEESALIVLNDENDNVIDALVKEKDLLSICPGLVSEETGPQGKPLTEISLAIDQICTQPVQSNIPESFHTLRYPQYSFQALQHYLPETNTKLDLIEDHILRQFADVRNSIDGLTKSINTSTYITSSEAARMRQEYRDVAMTIDDINDGLAAVIESESARTLSNLRHIVWADYITVTAVLVLTLVIFFNLLVVFATQDCTQTLTELYDTV